MAASALAPAASPAPAPAPASVHAKPRTALIYFGRRIDSAADQALVARYQFALVALWSGIGAPQLKASIDGIKARNPNIKLAQYLMLQEMRDASSPNDPNYPIWQALNTNDWWLRDAAGNRTQWTAAYSAYNINVTDWTRLDSSGKRWPQVKAKFDTDTLLSKMPGIDFLYIDGFGEASSDADFKRIGTVQSKKDPEIATAFHKGSMAYVSALRSLNPGLMIMGNTATEGSSSPEIKGQVEGLNLECMMGKTWSYETWGGWTRMMTEYRAALANTKAPHIVTFGACSPIADPAFYRYGLASALLEDGYFVSTVNGYTSFPWYDESDAPLGTAAEAPPTAATPSGIWTRKYTNGLVLVNPSKTTAASINVGAGYKYLNGTIDRTVNNGQPVSNNFVTLQPRSGLVLIKQ